MSITAHYAIAFGETASATPPCDDNHVTLIDELGVDDATRPPRTVKPAQARSSVAGRRRSS
jgi:hypothetical protein